LSYRGLLRRLVSELVEQIHVEGYSVDPNALGITEQSNIQRVRSSTSERNAYVYRRRRDPTNILAMKRGNSFNGFEAEDDSDGEPNTLGLRRAVKRLNTTASWGGTQHQNSLAAQAHAQSSSSSQRPGSHNYGHWVQTNVPGADLMGCSTQAQDGPSTSEIYHHPGTSFPGARCQIGSVPEYSHVYDEVQHVNSCAQQAAKGCDMHFSTCGASYTEMNCLLRGLHFERVQRQPTIQT